MIWSSCGKTLMDEIERIHVRAAKIIYKLDWSTPSDQVLVKANWNTIRDMNRTQNVCYALHISVTMVMFRIITIYC